MKINRLTLHNYRCYPELDIEFNPDITVLVARNGQGKTAVLDAISVALGPYLGAFDDAKGVGFSDHDARQVPHRQESGRVDMETHYPVTLEAMGSLFGKEMKWKRARSGRKGRTTIKESASLIKQARKLQTAVRNGEAVTLPLLAYYGTGRLWKEKRLTEKKQNTGATSRLSGYTDCMNPESSYRAFAHWLRMETLIAYEQHMLAMERGESAESLSRQTLLHTMQKSVNTVMKPSGWKNIRFSPSAREVVAEHADMGVLPVSILSDGIRNMIGLLADIAYRAVRLNPHLGEDAVRNTPGIVLVDEVDMHLHPGWQQLVLTDLKHADAFPRIQFIVTTHSPQVISTVKKEHIRILEIDNDVASIPLARTFGESSNDVLETVMHTDFRPALDHVRDLDRYFTLIDRGDYKEKEAEMLRQELEKVIGSDHKDLQRADRIIRRKEVLG
jgi:predicted ATP-binding protein involved in virulence